MPAYGLALSFGSAALRVYRGARQHFQNDARQKYERKQGAVGIRVATTQLRSQSPKPTSFT